MYIAIDIGGTNIRIARFDNLESPKIEAKVSYTVERDFDQGIKRIVAEVKNIAAGEKITGLGITLPGTVNREDGYIVSSVNLPEWDTKPVKQVLARELGVQVRCEQDVSAGALGEALYGAGRGKTKFVFMIWGTGFGGALVELVGKKRKITQMETGHQIYNWNGPKCPCGQNGCFELYIGGGFLTKLHKIRPEEIKDEKIWDDLAEKASHALINMLMNQPIGLIVFSGGLISKQPHLITRIQKILEAKQSNFVQPKLQFALLGEDSGLYGAVGLFIRDGSQSV
jgi:glucokinase